MGWFNFRYEHPAESVQVAGSFTNWQPTVQLEKTGTTFEKSVEIPDTTEKILYKVCRRTRSHIASIAVHSHIRAQSFLSELGIIG